MDNPSGYPHATCQNTLIEISRIHVSKDKLDFPKLNEIRTMNGDEVLIVSGNQNPKKIPSRAYFEVNRMKRATDTARYPVVPVEAGRAGDGVYVPL